MPNHLVWGDTIFCLNSEGNMPNHLVWGGHYFFPLLSMEIP